MIDTPVLSTEAQKDIASHAESAARISHSKIKKPLLWAFGGIALAAVAFIAFPPTIVPLVASVVAAVAGMLGATYAAGHALNERVMLKTKEETSGEGFVAKAKARAAGFAKFNKLADRIGDIGLFSYVGAVFLPLALPVIAPVAAVVGVLASFAWFGGRIAHAATGEVAHGTKSIETDIEASVNRGIAAATLGGSSAPSGLASVPSPSAGFGLAANANAPAAVVDDKPAVKAPAIKP